MSAASPSPGVSFSLNWQYWVSTHLVLLIGEGIYLKEGTQAKIFCAIQTREVSLSMEGMRNSPKNVLHTSGEKASSRPSCCRAGPSSRTEWTSKTGTARSRDCETKDLGGAFSWAFRTLLTPKVSPNYHCQSCPPAWQDLQPKTGWSAQVRAAPGLTPRPCKAAPPGCTLELCTCDLIWLGRRSNCYSKTGT